MRTEPAGAPGQFVTMAFVLVGLATAASGLALAAPGQSVVGQLLEASVLLAGSAARHAFLRRQGRSEARPSLATIGVTSALLIMLWGGDLAWQFNRSGTLPYELVLLVLTRDVALTAIALGGHPVCLRLSGGLSLAVVLFASVLTEHRLMSALLAVFSLLGGYWLILLYWSFLEIKLLEGRSRRPPALAIIVGVLLLGLMTITLVGPSQTIGVLAELVATSGGTRFGDPDARGGVGDGPNLVRGEKTAQSTGPVDSKVFLETLERSLYDASNEKWGEPDKPIKREHSLAVAVESDPRESQTERSKQPNLAREFSVVRKRPVRKGAPPTLQANAAYFVKGKTPLHLRQVAFDGFDGHRWLEPSLKTESIDLRLGFGGWILLPRFAAPVTAGDVAHRVVVGRVDSPLVPLPANAERFFIDRIDRPHFFGQVQPGVLTFRGEDGLPRQTVLDVRSHTIDPAKLRALRFPRGQVYALPKFVSLQPASDSASSPDRREDLRIAALASTWTQGIKRGWPQVEAVVERLRTDYRYEPGTVLPGDTRDPVASFLFERRAGDDYAFATAACLLLRSLDYPCRFVQGLYARPDGVDPASGQTPLRIPDDLHTWVEVMLYQGDWIVVEPTPGFRVLGPEPTFLARLAESLGVVVRGLRDDPWAAVLIVGALAAVVHYRRRLATYAALVAWRFECRGGPRDRIQATLRLLERCARIAGRRRPAGSTPRVWYRTVAASADEATRRTLDEFLGMADWALYSPATGDRCEHWSSDDVRGHCHLFASVRAMGWLLAPPRAATVRQPSGAVFKRLAAFVLLFSIGTAVGHAQSAAPSVGSPASTNSAAPSSKLPDPVSSKARAGSAPGSMARSKPAKPGRRRRIRDLSPVDEMSKAERLNELIMGGLTATWFFVLGAVIGSFLNVVVYRLPRDIPVWGRKSHCPACGAALTFRENMPIVGWLRLRGRCRTCSQPIPVRYMLVELTAGLVFLALFQVELVSGGKSVPLRPPNTYSGVVWIIWYPKWDLIALYGYHLFCLCTLLCAALIHLDGRRVPIRLWFVGGLVGLLAPLAVAELHPVPPIAPGPLRLPHSGVSPGELLTSALGAAAGGTAGVWLSLLTRRATIWRALALTLGFVGIYLGWQAAVSVALMTAILLAIVGLLASRATASRLAIACASVATFTQIVLWRSLEDLPFWPSSRTNPSHWAGCAVLFVAATIAGRFGRPVGANDAEGGAGEASPITAGAGPNTEAGEILATATVEPTGEEEEKTGEAATNGSTTS